ncbi:DUF917 domain-containing protein [Kineobactrum salinum]|uniref:DUF917 domain-containing protein n=1 Tax=Kineobactrum salinum TaxID=2708301 RepID=A0A6C0TZX3_9GAMM|nr:DUF917 domain-containing protein [Kineobactrum salinum]QIB65390.1 DUF917 domain-containing protein [Kineobactrum salinum]
MYTIDSIQDIQDMARGAVLLGTGGGGDPYVGELFVHEQIRKGHYPTVISSGELDEDAFVVSIAGIGAPTVILEHLVSEKTLLQLLARAEIFYGRRIDALISAEIGGANSMFPLALSAISGVPVLDADGVGRAVPQLEMTTFSIYGVRATPCILMDDSGNFVNVETSSDRMAEDICRVVTGAMGAMAFSAIYPMSGKQAQDCAVQDTLSQTLEIGRAIRRGREGAGDVFEPLLAYLNSWEGRIARIIFDGKITDVTHETRDGWHWGLATMCGIDDPAQQCTVEIRNEFIVARVNGRTATVVPDLITILDRESGEPMTGEMLAYGQRVKVLGYSADPMLRRPESLEVLGPRMFGLDEDFQPIESL